MVIQVRLPVLPHRLDSSVVRTRGCAPLLTRASSAFPIMVPFQK